MNENAPASHDRSHDALVVAARTDREALGRLFDVFYPVIWTFCLRRLGQSAAADDLTSDVFLKVAKGMPSFSGTMEEDFRRWIFRIAINEMNANRRQSRRREAILENAARDGRIRVSDQVEPIDEFSSEIEWSVIEKVLLSLSKRELDVVSLRYFEQFSDRQISAIVDIPENQVRVVLERAIVKLRQRLGIFPSASPKAKTTRTS